MNYSSEISARTDKDSTLSTIYKQNQKEMALLALQTVQTSCVLDQFFAKTGCPGLSFFFIGYFYWDWCWPSDSETPLFYMFLFMKNVESDLGSVCKDWLVWRACSKIPHCHKNKGPTSLNWRLTLCDLFHHHQHLKLKLLN